MTLQIFDSQTMKSPLRNTNSMGGSGSLRAEHHAMRGLPSPSAVRDYDSLRKDNVNGTATNIERVEDHLEDLDHYLRLSPKNVGTSPSCPKQPTTPVAFEMDEAHAEAEAEKEAPATEEEKKEGVKQLLMMLRAQKHWKLLIAAEK